MRERIALTDLNAELNRFTAGVHSFATRLKSTAEDVRDKHAAALKTLDGKLSTAAARKSAAEVSAEELQQRLSHEGECIAALNNEVQAAEEVCSALPAEIQTIKDSLDRDTTDLRRREAALANQESIQESKLRAMRGAVDLYRGRLGLDFRKEEKEELLLVFTHLDPNDHQREFQLGVHVVADNRYTVTRCHPELEDLGPCLEELNKGDDDFRGFVRRVRKLFQAHVAQG
ncbi:g8006 [Coccomyxa viridis]|uniref:Kinetochore protein SPC25 n=1 Tax=Coccomyxa viridis TaxID=1274662 RepID=A0ABP1FZ98_9CHLO